MWYWCKNREDKGRLWKKCGLSSIIQSASSLPAQSIETEVNIASVVTVSYWLRSVGFGSVLS